MKTEMQDAFIGELDEMINDWDNRHNLFAGGCCFAAYGLALYLQKLGIKYTTVIFQYDEILNTRKFDSAINGIGVSHVAIEVTYRHKRFMIGRCDTIYKFFEITRFEYHVRRYRNITPNQILNGYMNKDWNQRWDTGNNKSLIDDIREIAKKYCPEI